MNPDPNPVLTGSESGSGLFSEVGSGSGPNRSGSATLETGFEQTLLGPFGFIKKPPLATHRIYISDDCRYFNPPINLVGQSLWAFAGIYVLIFTKMISSFRDTLKLTVILKHLWVYLVFTQTIYILFSLYFVFSFFRYVSPISSFPFSYIIY